MTKLNKWVLIEAGHDEDERDIDVGILEVLDNEEEAKEALKEQVEEWNERWGGCEDDEYDDECDNEDSISWSDNDTKVTITSGDDCDGWCKVYKIEEI